MIRSSTTPPPSLHIKVYWACPTTSLVTSFVSKPFSTRSAFGPATRNSPMCEMSKSPTRSRTAVCSARMPEYCTGISQPPNGTIFPPASRCEAYNGVRLRFSALCMARYVNGEVHRSQFRNSGREWAQWDLKNGFVLENEPICKLGCKRHKYLGISQIHKKVIEFEMGSFRRTACFMQNPGEGKSPL